MKPDLFLQQGMVKRNVQLTNIIVQISTEELKSQNLLFQKWALFLPRAENILLHLRNKLTRYFHRDLDKTRVILDLLKRLLFFVFGQK